MGAAVPVSACVQAVTPMPTATPLATVERPIRAVDTARVRRPTDRACAMQPSPRVFGLALHVATAALVGTAPRATARVRSALQDSSATGTARVVRVSLVLVMHRIPRGFGEGLAVPPASLRILVPIVAFNAQGVFAIPARAMVCAATMLAALAFAVASTQPRRDFGEATLATTAK